MTSHRHTAVSYTRPVCLYSDSALQRYNGWFCSTAKHVWAHGLLGHNLHRHVSTRKIHSSLWWPTNQPAKQATSAELADNTSRDDKQTYSESYQQINIILHIHMCINWSLNTEHIVVRTIIRVRSDELQFVHVHASKNCWTMHRFHDIKRPPQATPVYKKKMWFNLLYWGWGGTWNCAV